MFFSDLPESKLDDYIRLVEVSNKLRDHNSENLGSQKLLMLDGNANQPFLNQEGKI